MPRSSFWILYAHILAACLFEGAMVFFTFLLRNLKSRLSPEEYVGEATSILRFYHPFILICMGVLIMTGAWHLTDLKAAMGPAFARLFVPLGLKLGIVFVQMMTMSFQFFALGLRLTRGAGPAGNGRPPGSAAAENLQLLRALERMNIANAIIGLIAIFFGLVLNKGF